MTKREAEVIVGLAQNDLNITKASEKMQYHKNTLLYHINKIKESTGANPKYFYDMCKLLPMAEEVLWGESASSIDYELIIRCKDCKFWLKEFGEVCSREDDWFYISPDDFCSRAVMRK